MKGINAKSVARSGMTSAGTGSVSARSTHLVGADFAGTIRWHDEVIRIEVARPDL
jgi:hypothetical protein